MGVPLINILCALFDCSVDELSEKLSCPFNREEADSTLRGLWVQTKYKNRRGSKHLFRIAGLSIQDSKHLKAYKGFLGITVVQHFYARHRIRIRHFNLPCVIENTCYGDFHYYPIELLEIVGPVCFRKLSKKPTADPAAAAAVKMSRPCRYDDNDADDDDNNGDDEDSNNDDDADNDDNDKLVKCFNSMHL